MDITRFLPAESSAGMIEAGAAELTAKVKALRVASLTISVPIPSFARKKKHRSSLHKLSQGAKQLLAICFVVPTGWLELLWTQAAAWPSGMTGDKQVRPGDTWSRGGPFSAQLGSWVGPYPSRDGWPGFGGLQLPWML